MFSIAILALATLASFAFGCFVMLSAKSAIHEAEAGLAFLISVTSFGLAAVIYHLYELRRELRPPAETTHKPPTLAELREHGTGGRRGGE